ncbi:MAG TPA: type II toxin-antitoxin system prevent-host-death family antitoxin [Pseudonocardiaceae bacterium]
MLMNVITAEAFELPLHESAPAEAVDAAEHGHVVYLTRHGAPVAAIVPANEAGTAENHHEALEDIGAAPVPLAEAELDGPESDVWDYFQDLVGAMP